MILQCLSWTRPLVAYLLEKGHKRECKDLSFFYTNASQTLFRSVFFMHFSFDSMFCLTGLRNDWCFFCEFQTHVERASRSRFPFSPMNIISRLTNIGGTLGYGRQEDAHEFMRSVSLSHENSQVLVV